MKPSRGINAYVFVADAHPGDLERLRALRAGTGVRAVALLAGPYDAIVAVVAPSLKALNRTVHREIRGGKSPLTETVIALVEWVLGKIPMSPKLPPTVAFVRIKVEQGRVTDVLQSVRGLPQTIAATAVAGNFDILLEIGGPTFQSVASVLTGELQRIGGIASTVTSFATEFVHPR